jgi:hypothetical protein
VISLGRTILCILSCILLSTFCKAASRDTLIAGVKVVFNKKEAAFPHEWKISPVNVKCLAMSPSAIIRCTNIVFTASKKYPPDLIGNNLRTTYFFRSLAFYNVRFGSTNSTDAIYLCNNGRSRGYSDEYLEQCFHHELSSILLRNYPGYLDTTAWKNLNDPYFSYNDPEEGLGALRNHRDSQVPDSNFCSHGFLTEYSRSGVENDINTIAQNLFLPSENFWRFAHLYPTIRQKIDLVIAFYHRINPIFTASYFLSLKK